MGQIQGGISFVVATGLEADIPADGVEVGRPMLTRDTHRLLFGGGEQAAPVALKVRMQDVVGLLTGKDGLISPDLIPPIALNSATAAADIAERNQLLADAAVQAGDMVVVADAGDGRRRSYIVANDGESWIETSSDGAVHSVNGQTGTLVLTTADIDEPGDGTRLYYTDARVGQYIAGVVNKANGVAGVDASGKLSVSVIPPSIIRAGDDATRLGSGDAPAGALFSADGEGGTAWATAVDGGTF